MKIRIHSEATAELEEALDWYGVRSFDAASRFAISIDNALAMIAKHPERFPESAAKHRSIRLDGFPYQIVYQAGREILVVAIAHAKRRPGYWKRRK